MVAHQARRKPSSHEATTSGRAGEEAEVGAVGVEVQSGDNATHVTLVGQHAGYRTAIEVLSAQEGSTS